jgi:hypothetical protein
MTLGAFVVALPGDVEMYLVFFVIGEAKQLICVDPLCLRCWLCEIPMISDELGGFRYNILLVFGPNVWGELRVR